MERAITMMDYPKNRASEVCMCCGNDKPKAQIVCWPCFRLYDGRHGFTPEVVAVLNRVEAHREG